MTNNSINSGSQVLQYIYSTSASVITLNTTIAGDDTIPQKTEGDEVLTLSITPYSSTSILEIIFSSNIGSDGTAKSIQTALFQDSTDNSIAAVTTYFEDTSNGRCGYLRHIMVSGTTSSTTFKIRVGPEASTCYVNGDSSGNRLFGGICSTTLNIKEYYL